MKRILFIIILLIPILFFTSKGTADIDCWLTWVDSANLLGIIKGYSIADCNPPLNYLLVVWSCKFAHFLGFSYFIGLKSLLYIFFLLAVFVFYRFSRDLLLTTFVALALILSSVALGYLDILFAPFLIASLFFLNRKQYFLSSVLYSLCCLVKFQPIIIAPFLFLYVANADKKTLFTKIVVPAIAVTVFVVSVFHIGFYHSIYIALTKQSALSYGAFNFPYVIQYFTQFFRGVISFGERVRFENFIDVHSSPAFLLIKPFFFLVFFYILFLFFRKQKTFENLLIFSIIGYCAYFFLNTGVHENHLFTVVILSAILAVVNPAKRYLFVIFSIFFNLNLFLLYGTGRF
jgi:Gpi18-like mannosyltransferase